MQLYAPNFIVLTNSFILLTNSSNICRHCIQRFIALHKGISALSCNRSELYDISWVLFSLYLLLFKLVFTMMTGCRGVSYASFRDIFWVSWVICYLFVENNSSKFHWASLHSVKPYTLSIMLMILNVYTEVVQVWWRLFFKFGLNAG